MPEFSGKVYFPRLAIPLSTVISSLGKFILNFVLFMGFVLYFLWMTAVPIQITFYAFLLPLLVLQMALLGLGCGIFSLSSGFQVQGSNAFDEFWGAVVDVCYTGSLSRIAGAWGLGDFYICSILWLL